MENKNLLTTKELCNHYKVCKSTITLWKNKGMPFEQISLKKTYFDLEKVKEWHSNRITDSKN